MSSKRVKVTGANGGPYDYTGSASEERAFLTRDTEDDAPPPPNFDHVVKGFGKDSATKRMNRLTPENVEQMALLVAGGTPIPTACTAIGAGRSWDKWGQRARAAERAGVEPGWGDDQSPELFYYLKMEQAKAAFEASMVARIGAAAATDWKAAAWLIERRAPRRWFPKHQLTLMADGKKMADIEVMSTAKLLEIAKGVLPDHSEIKVLQSEFNHDSDSPRDVVDAELEEEG